MIESGTINEMFRLLPYLSLAVLLCLTIFGCATPPSNRPLSVEIEGTRIVSTVALTPAPPRADVRPTRAPVTVVTTTPNTTSPPTTATDIPPLTCPQTTLPNTGIRCYIAPSDVFLHPVSIVIDGATVYLIDGGRVLQLSLTEPTEPNIILQPGDAIAGIQVIEPLDLALVDNGVAVLDRAGDVYRYNVQAAAWVVERYDRPIRDLSSHYFVAITSYERYRYLLETSYSFVLRYGAGERVKLSLVDEAYLVDMAVLVTDSDGDGTEDVVTYVLQRPFQSEDSMLVRFVNGGRSDRFQPPMRIRQPRQIVVHDDRLFLLDRAGRRLTQLDNISGEILSQSDFAIPFSSFAIMADGTIVMATGNALYFRGHTEFQQAIAASKSGSQPQPHDWQLWSQMPSLVSPIPNLAIADRDLRLPGAPRHYRLGVHEGTDFYWSPGREVVAIADGVVTRALIDYEAPTGRQFDLWRLEAREAGYTPPHLLDAYRGRQVWIAHENGLVSRYAHLSAIEDGIILGAQVQQGQKIGEVGNSGSPASVDSETADSHLHFELWLGEEAYLGQFLRPIETRELLETLFAVTGQ